MAMPASTRSSCRSLKMFLVGAVTISSRTAGSFSDRSRNRRGTKICAIPDPMPSVRVSDGSPRSIRKAEHIADDPLGVVEERAPAFGELDPARRAAKQRKAYFAL